MAPWRTANQQVKILWTITLWVLAPWGDCAADFHVHVTDTVNVGATENNDVPDGNIKDDDLLDASTKRWLYSAFVLRTTTQQTEMSRITLPWMSAWSGDCGDLAQSQPKRSALSHPAPCHPTHSVFCPTRSAFRPTLPRPLYLLSWVDEKAGTGTMLVMHNYEEDDGQCRPAQRWHEVAMMSLAISTVRLFALVFSG